MEVQQVQAAIEETPKGANIILEWVRPCKTRKGVPHDITKSVRMVGRMGIDYDHQKAVVAKRESGELPAENAGLPWGTWLEYPYLIEHKGEIYLRLYKGTSDKVHPEAHFFVNGVEVSKDEVAPFLLASELAEKDGETFTCNIRNMTRIHAESEWIMLVVGQIGQESVVTEVPVPAKVLATANVG